MLCRIAVSRPHIGRHSPAAGKPDVTDAVWQVVEGVRWSGCMWHGRWQGAQGRQRADYRQCRRRVRSAHSRLDVVTARRSSRVCLERSSTSTTIVNWTCTERSTPSSTSRSRHLTTSFSTALSYLVYQSAVFVSTHLFSAIVMHDTPWRFGVAVTRWSRSTQLFYIEPG